jgi:hypothetical protein
LKTRDAVSIGGMALLLFCLISVAACFVLVLDILVQ